MTQSQNSGNSRGQVDFTLISVPIETGEQRTLSFHHETAGLKENPIRISPDGRQVVFIAGGSQQEVWALENFLPATATK